MLKISETTDLAQASASQISLEQVLVDSELAVRESPTPDYKKEAETLARLADTLVQTPETIFQKLSEAALNLCAAESAGVTTTEIFQGRESLRWSAVAGQLDNYLYHEMPRDFSPFGFAMDSARTQLFFEPAKHYEWMKDIEHPIRELLIAPIMQNAKAIGTLWIAAHQSRKKFTKEDLRILNSLSLIATLAFRVNQASVGEAIQNQNLWLEEVLNRLPIGLIMAEPGTAKYRFTNKAARILLGQAPDGTRPELSPEKLIVRDLEGRALGVDEIPSARASRGVAGYSGLRFAGPYEC